MFFKKNTSNKKPKNLFFQAEKVNGFTAEVEGNQTGGKKIMRNIF